MADSRHEGLSPYAYVYNNPVLYSDHEGKFGFAGALIGGLIGAAASLTKSVIQNGFESLGDSRTWAKVGVNALGGALVGATGGLGLAYGFIYSRNYCSGYGSYSLFLFYDINH